MAVRSRIFAHRLTLPTGVWTPCYMVPTGRTAIVHWCTVLNRTTIARDIIVGVRRSGLIAQLVRNAALPAQAVLSAGAQPFVVEAGCELMVYNGAQDTQDNVHVFASGSLLEGVPL